MQAPKDQETTDSAAHNWTPPSPNLIFLLLSIPPPYKQNQVGMCDKQKKTEAEKKNRDITEYRGALGGYQRAYN